MSGFLKFLAVAVVVYALVGFFVVPPIAKKQMEERLEAELQRSVTIARVRVNPFAISATVEGLEVSAPDGSASWLGWQRLYVNMDPLKSFTGDWAVGRIALQGFHGAVEVREDGTLNFSDLIEKYSAQAREPSEPSAWARPVRIERMDVTSAQVAFTDLSRDDEFKTVVGPVNFSLTKFRTSGSGGAAYRFEATSEAGERFQWMGTLAAAPLASVGEWRIENVQLAKYAPYLADRMQAVVVDGALTAGGSYDVSLAPGDRRMTLSEGSLLLKQLSVIEQEGGAPVVEVGVMEISGVSADATDVLAPKVAIGTIRVNQGRAAVRREKDGTLNLLAMLRPKDDASGPEAEADASGERRLEATAEEIAVSGFALELRDEAGPEPVEVALEKIEAKVTAFTLEPGAPIPVSVAFDVKPQGTVNVTGNVMLAPFQAVVGVDVARVALAPFGPGLRSVSEARIARGLGSVKGEANVSAEGGSTFSGEARLEDFAIAGREGPEVAGLSEFTVSDIKVATLPRLALSAGEVKVVRPFARVVRAEDGTLNLAALTPAKTSNEEADTAGATNDGGETTDDGEAPEIAVTRVLVQEGEFTFADESVQPQVNLALGRVNGALRNMSSLRPELGDAEFQAQVNGAPAVRVLGRVNPLTRAPFVDMQLEVDAVDLVPASPYFGKFVGYELTSGRLFVETRAKLADERLDMTNNVQVEQFALGAATNSPDAVKMPVKLGVALLKDAEGKITLDVPVQGSLADPQFDIGKVVGQVFSNLFAKAATSPFALLGSMFGGGGEELGQQEFLPGGVTLTEESRARLEVVRRALTERPALMLEIEAGYDREADAEGFKRRMLAELIRAEIGLDDAAGAESERELTGEERERGLRQLFVKRFPSGVTWASNVDERAAAESTQASAPPGAEPAAREEEERRGFFRKTWDIATLKGPRDWISGRSRREEEQRRAEAERLAVEQRAAAERAALASREPAQAGPGGALPSLEEMERVVLASLAVEGGELAALATERAERVRDVLLADGTIDASRVTILDSPGDEPKVKGPRAMLHLR